MTLRMQGAGTNLDAELSVNPMFAQSAEAMAVPNHRLPDGPMQPATAYQIVHDHLMLDGTPGSTWPPSCPPGWSPKPTGSCPSVSTRT